MCDNPNNPLNLRVGQTCSLDNPSSASTCCPDNQLVCNGTQCVPYCELATDPSCDFCIDAFGQSCSEGLNATAAAIALPPSVQAAGRAGGASLAG